jgi:hypothetical protein
MLSLWKQWANVSLNFLIVRFPNFMQTKSFKNFECFPRKWYLVPALMQTWMSDLQWIYALVQWMHSTAPWQCLQMIQMWVWISLREFVDCQSIQLSHFKQSFESCRSNKKFSEVQKFIENNKVHSKLFDSSHKESRGRVFQAEYERMFNFKVPYDSGHPELNLNFYRNK